MKVLHHTVLIVDSSFLSPSNATKILSCSSCGSPPAVLRIASLSFSFSVSFQGLLCVLYSVVSSKNVRIFIFMLAFFRLVHQFCACFFVPRVFHSGVVL